MIETFTAVAMCPSCGDVAVHPFRLAEPVPEDELPEVEVDYVKRVAWGGQAVRIDPILPRLRSRPDNEPGAVVVRQCGCGREWAQS